LSKEWLRQRKKDPYYRKAKQEGLRSRATFKLEEVNERVHIIRRGDRVLDLGAAPGGWSQYSIGTVGDKGLVVAVDMVAMPPIPGVHFIQGDIEDPSVIEKVLAISKEYDAVVSDIAPHLSGNRVYDRGRSLALAWMVMGLAVKVLSPGGSALVKMFQGDEVVELKEEFGSHFGSIDHLKPRSSSKSSSEIFILFRGFRRRLEG